MNFPFPKWSKPVLVRLVSRLFFTVIGKLSEHPPHGRLWWQSQVRKHYRYAHCVPCCQVRKHYRHAHYVLCCPPYQGWILELGCKVSDHSECTYIHIKSKLLENCDYYLVSSKSWLSFIQNTWDQRCFGFEFFFPPSDFGKLVHTWAVLGMELRSI